MSEHGKRPLLKPSRDEIVAALHRSAEAPAPPVDPVFVEQLDRHLRSIDLSASPRVRRRLGRAAVAGIVGAIGLAGAAAAAAGVVAWRDSPSPAPTTAVATTEPSTTTVPATSTTEPAPTTTPPTTTTVLVSIVPVVTTIAPPTTVPATTEPPSTVAATTTSTVPPAPTTTEVHTPATLKLKCAVVDGGVSCDWGAAPAGTTRFALLRSEPPGVNGRAFFTDPATTAYVDTQVVPGTTYNYLVHALDGSDHSLAHSDFVTITAP